MSSETLSGEERAERVRMALAEAGWRGDPSTIIVAEWPDGRIAPSCYREPSPDAVPLDLWRKALAVAGEDPAS